MHRHHTETGEQETRYGMIFRRYTLKADAPKNETRPLEIWWNAEHFLPLRIVRAVSEGTWVQELVNVESRVDDGMLTAPISRFPDYAAMDRTDFADLVSANAPADAPLPRHHH